VLRGRETTTEAPDPALTSPDITLTDAWVWALGSVFVIVGVMLAVRVR